MGDFKKLKASRDFALRPRASPLPQCEVQGRCCMRRRRVWCALQAKVEKEHFGKRCEVNTLARSVMNTWNNGHLDNVIASVFKRLQKVLVLIIEAKGKNDLVETKRGKKFVDLDLPIDLTSDSTLGDELASAPELFEEVHV